MEIGPTGLHGELAVLVVEEETKHRQEIVVILHQPLVAKTVVQLTWIQQHKLAIISHALLVIYILQNIYFCK